MTQATERLARLEEAASPLPTFGRVLVRCCFAGRDLAAVLAAVGLRAADLFDDEHPIANWRR